MVHTSKYEFNIFGRHASLVASNISIYVFIILL